MDECEEEEEPSFSDPEDFVNDIEDEELLSDLLQDKPLGADVIDCCCVVVNVPQVGPEQLDELKRNIHKFFSKFGDITTEYYPEADSVTKDYIFMEYATPAQAREAVKRADGHRLNRQHMFMVTMFTDFDKCMNMSNDWEPPEEQPFKDIGNLQHWLLDPDSCDQYSVIYESSEGLKTAIFSCNATEPVEERTTWTESCVCWSPKGTYLATFHQRGIVLWGGEKFKRIQRFNHLGVCHTDFSPCERYMVTCSSLMDNEEDLKASVIIWDIKTGQKKRDFHCESSAHWPIFKWSYDGKFFARMAQDTLSIYETPSMCLLDKKSIGIKDFSWSPGDNIIAFWVPEDKDFPAKVTLVQIPSRQEISRRNLFCVVDCKLHWQNNGDYLCVKVGRTPKGTQGMVTNFEIFRMREKAIPFNVVEMKDSIVTFALEPNGSRFAVVHGESPSRYNVSIYHIKKNDKIELMKMFENQQVNHIFWSPRGQFLVLAGLGTQNSINGHLAFLDTSDCTMMHTDEHYNVSNVEWDPTGRYVITSVSVWSHIKVDNAYWLWTFQGRLLQKNNKERLHQLLWRPRPATLLSEEEIKAINKDLKRFSKIFEQEDRLSQSKASKELVDKRRAMAEEYRQYRQAASQAYQKQRDLRLKLREGVDSNTDGWEEENVEFFIGEESIPL